MTIKTTRMLDGYTDQIPLGTLKSRTVRDALGDTGEMLTIREAGAGSLGGGKALQTINDKDLVLNKTKIGGKMDAGRIGAAIVTQAFIDRCASGDIVEGQEILAWMDCPASMTQVASYQNHLVESGRGSLSAAQKTENVSKKREQRLEKSYKADCEDIRDCINHEGMDVDQLLDAGFSQTMIDAAMNETPWDDYKAEQAESAIAAK